MVKYRQREICIVPKIEGVGAMGNEITLHDIASNSGVSKSTVSLVMQGSPLVAESTRKRVQESAQKLGYVYNRAAASLRSRQTGNLGFIVSSVSNPFFAELTNGVEQFLGIEGKTVLLGQHSEDHGAQERLINSMLESRVDGLIIVPAYGTTSNEISRLLTLNIPTVLLTRRIPKVNLHYIGSDNVSGAYEAVRHLIAHKRKNIVLIGGRVGTPAHDERVDGLTRAIQEEKIPASRIRVLGDSATRQAGFDAAKELIASGIDNVGILAYNDIVASGILAAFRESKFKVGKDVSVISIDDIESSKFESPALSTVDVNAPELGRKAAESLLELIAGEAKVKKTVFLNNKLIIRESCGCTAEKKVA
jgi:LacI family transcriptional regulator